MFTTSSTCKYNLTKVEKFEQNIFLSKALYGKYSPLWILDETITLHMQNLNLNYIATYMEAQRSFREQSSDDYTS
jgi:hypothetical protein